MNTLYDELTTLLPEIQAKQLQGFLKQFKKPDVHPSRTFSDQLKRKINKKMKAKKESDQREILVQVPSFAKWRFRLTGFVTAICAFLFVFILSFLTDFFGEQIFVPTKFTQVERLQLQNPSPELQVEEDAVADQADSVAVLAG